MQERFSATILIAFALAGMARAQEAGDDLSPAETIKLLEQVEKLRGQVLEQRYGVHASSIQAFKTAAASSAAAYDFYLKCYKEVHFERRDARESEYREWRERNVKYLRSKEHSGARQLQLQYLVLTLQVAQMKTDAERRTMVPRLAALMDVSLSSYAVLGGSKKILHEDALGSVYAEVYDLKATLGHLEGWGAGPLDIAGIYEKFVLPLYRAPGSAENLASQWDKRIAHQTKLVAALDSEEAEQRFSEGTLPRLRWLKQMDLLKSGKRREALTAMVALVQANPKHDEIDAWLSELKGILAGDIDPPSFGDTGVRRSPSGG